MKNIIILQQIELRWSKMKLQKLIDNIIDNLVNIKELQEWNDIIAKKVVSSSISGEDLKKISLEIQEVYNKFISKKNSKTNYIVKPKNGFSFKNESDKNFLDEIQEINVTTKRGKIFYKNEKIQIYLETNAYKNVNIKQRISFFY
ncbi:hypothetical protein [Spiroplasma sp. SV19]|uniref:hypothetical protein n=1 Tax=Spiroplasma sp. SV19 TaxID=2570468 RepID=UPI0024B78486|nr:hypothetical protein [Spiroplasma sp. SV19]WHQ37500.1 hypothetical protein E7Y35_06620 [Spiroplasma sp. SV19]